MKYKVPKMSGKNPAAEDTSAAEDADEPDSELEPEASEGLDAATSGADETPPAERAPPPQVAEVSAAAAEPQISSRHHLLLNIVSNISE